MFPFCLSLLFLIIWGWLSLVGLLPSAKTLGYIVLPMLGFIIGLLITENKKRKAAEAKNTWWKTFTSYNRHNYRNHLQMILALSQLQQNDKLADYVQNNACNYDTQAKLIKARLYNTLFELEKFPDLSRLDFQCEVDLPDLSSYDTKAAELIKIIGSVPGPCRIKLYSYAGGYLLSCSFAGCECQSIDKHFAPDVVVSRDDNNLRVQLVMKVEKNLFTGILSKKAGQSWSLGG